MSILLPAREIVSQEQKERERLVQEEGALARRVEALRELAETETKKLQDWQLREFEKHKGEVEKRTSELSRLDKVIAQKNKEVEAFFGPLDKQWALFKQVEKKKIEAELAEAAKMRSDLFLREKEQDVRDEELTKREKKVSQDRAQALELTRQAEKEREDAKDASEKVKAEAARLWEAAQKAQETVQNVLEKAKTTLQEADLKKEALDAREKELEERETQVLIKELKYYSPIQKL